VALWDIEWEVAREEEIVAGSDGRIPADVIVRNSFGHWPAGAGLDLNCSRAT
jgi:hypothetical protein